MRHTALIRSLVLVLALVLMPSVTRANSSTMPESFKNAQLTVSEKLRLLAVLLPWEARMSLEHGWTDAESSDILNKSKEAFLACPTYGCVFDVSEYWEKYLSSRPLKQREVSHE